MKQKGHVTIIHLLPHPMAALRFVAPLVQALNAEGIRAELWVQRVAGFDNFYASIPCAKRYAVFNLSLNVLKMLSGGFALWRAFLRLKPRVIEAHTSRGALIPLLAAKIAGVPIRIYHNHGLPYLGYAGLMRFGLKNLERLNTWLASHTLTVTHAMHETMLHDKIVREEQCEIIQPGSACGIDLNEFNVCSDLNEKSRFKEYIGFHEADFLVLFVGRPHARKGFDSIVKCWEKHFSYQPGIQLILAGATRGDLVKIIGEKLPENVHPLGFVENVKKYYAAADVVVLPSEHEGFGYALLEGAASLCCLIASDIPGPDAIVDAGVNGFTIPVGDIDSLANCIIALRNDSGLRQRMARAAKQKALSFDRSIFLKNYTYFVQSLL